MKFYEIIYENGKELHGDFYNYADALNYAESRSGGHDFTIYEYDSEEAFFESFPAEDN